MPGVLYGVHPVGMACSCAKYGCIASESPRHSLCWGTQARRGPPSEGSERRAEGRLCSGARAGPGARVSRAWVGSSTQSQEEGVGGRARSPGSLAPPPRLPVYLKGHADISAPPPPLPPRRPWGGISSAAAAAAGPAPLPARPTRPRPDPRRPRPPGPGEGCGGAAPRMPRSPGTRIKPAKYIPVATAAALLVGSSTLFFVFT